MSVLASAAAAGTGDGAFSSVASSAKNILASVLVALVTDTDRAWDKCDAEEGANAFAAPKRASSVAVRANIILGWLDYNMGCWVWAWAMGRGGTPCVIDKVRKSAKALAAGCLFNIIGQINGGPATTFASCLHITAGMNCNNAQHDGIVARLEVRREAGEGGPGQWSDAGPINLDTATAATLVDGVPVAATRTPATGSGTRSTSTPPAAAPITKRKRMLPRRTKLLLSPNAKVKGDRKENFLFHHSSDDVDTNLLILLHGAGDTHRAFREFAKRMDLPQTATLSIHASSCNNGFTILPFNLGHTWFEEMDYAVTGDALADRDPRRLSSLSSAIDNLIKILQSLYPQEGDAANEGWMPERIFLFGYSAGACLVMETCLRLMKQKEMHLGGAICVAGGVKCEIPPAKEREEVEVISEDTRSFEGPTPILLIVGSNDGNFPPNTAQKASTLYNDTGATKESAATIFVKDGKGPAMVGSEDEMRFIMEFMAKRLVREMPASAIGATAPS